MSVPEGDENVASSDTRQSSGRSAASNGKYTRRLDSEPDTSG
jgi:hypothetical protein